MEVEVRVGGWEHECCGTAIERGQRVDLGCLRAPGPDGRPGLVETHHDIGDEVRVAGRVSDIRVVRQDGSARPIRRLPGGPALRGFDAEDDGHLEAPRSGEPVPAGREFLLTVQVAGGGTKASDEPGPLSPTAPG